MSTVVAALRPSPIPASSVLRSDPAAQAFMLLRILFTVAPILFGLDKFANVLTDDWTRYLAPAFNDIIPGSAADAMHIVGVVEIAEGLARVAVGAGGHRRASTHEKGRSHGLQCEEEDDDGKARARERAARAPG